MAHRRPGPVPKGNREQVTLRVPADHNAQYRELARAQGLPLCDYLAAMLARAHDFETPSYLHRNDDKKQTSITLREAV